MREGRWGHCPTTSRSTSIQVLLHKTAIEAVFVHVFVFICNLSVFFSFFFFSFLLHSKWMYMNNFSSSTMFHCSHVDGPLWPPPHKHRRCGATRYLFMIQIRQSNNRKVKRSVLVVACVKDRPRSSKCICGGLWECGRNATPYNVAVLARSTSHGLCSTKADAGSIERERERERERARSRL